jgi:hypothetical protein
MLDVECLVTMLIGWIDGRWMKQDLNDTNVVHIFVHHSISAMTCMFGTLAS